MEDLNDERLNLLASKLDAHVTPPYVQSFSEMFNKVSPYLGDVTSLKSNLIDFENVSLDDIRSAYATLTHACLCSPDLLTDPTAVTTDMDNRIVTLKATDAFHKAVSIAPDILMV